jgi:hypothetical protein
VNFISPATEICAGFADNFRQELATLKSVAKYLVWLTVCYFTDGKQGGGSGESGAYAPHFVILPGSVEKGRGRACFLSPWRDYTPSPNTAPIHSISFESVPFSSVGYNLHVSIRINPKQSFLTNPWETGVLSAAI